MLESKGPEVMSLQRFIAIEEEPPKGQVWPESMGFLEESHK